jgi:hypothetical protein
MPVWVYGMSAATGTAPAAIFRAILIPVLVVILITFWSTYAGLAAMENMPDAGSMAGMRRG